MMMPGGFGANKQPDEETTAFFNSVRPAVEQQTGQSFSDWQIVHYQSQVVAGTNFWVKIAVGAGDKDFIHVKIFRPLPHTGDPAEVKEVHQDKTGDDSFM